MLDQSEIDRARYDILSVVSSRIQLKKTGKNYSACCPFHKERSPSFSVVVDKAFCYCHGCGAGGDAIEFIMQYDNLSFPEAVDAINGSSASTVTPEMVRQRQVARADNSPRPGDHVEDAEGAARLIDRCQVAEQHPYLLRNGTAQCNGFPVLKGQIIVPLFKMYGDAVNLAAINADGDIRYSAGGISYGACAKLEPRELNVFDGQTILCIDYAEAWRLWWLHKGQSRIICAMSWQNAKWISDKQKERFTHIACAKEYADEFMDYGHEVIVIDEPYARRAS